MPESFIQLPNDGSGKKSHTFQVTIGANDVHDEIVRLGDQYLGTYVIDQSSVSAATANDHLMQIMAGGTLNAHVRRIRIYQSVLATTVTIALLQVFRLTTAGTGGTTNAVDAVDGTDAAAGSTAQSLPTVKGTESTRLLAFPICFVQTLPTAGLGYQGLLLADLDFDKNPRLKPIRIPAGAANGIAIKNTTAVAGASVQIIADITEQNF